MYNLIINPGKGSKIIFYQFLPWEVKTQNCKVSNFKCNLSPSKLRIPPNIHGSGQIMYPMISLEALISVQMPSAHYF